MFFLKRLPTRATLERYRQRFPAMDIDSVENALSMLRTASLLLRELDAYFTSRGLSQLKYLVLVVLDREQHPLTASALADELDVARPVLSRTLQSLTAERMVAVEASDRDGRSKTIHLTPKGARILEDLLPGYYKLIGNFMKELEP